MTPYYQESGITIYHGDCRDVLPELPMADLILTDPPYGLGSIGIVGWHQTNYQRKRSVEPQSWDELRPDEIVAELPSLAPKVVIWGGNFFHLPISRGWLCWYKPDSAQSFSQFEIAWTNQDMISRLFTFPIGATRRSGHPAAKPLPLIKWTLQAVKFAGDVILDPFMGSGTTLRAAKDLGHKAIGIELEERYCEMAANRLRQCVLNFEVSNGFH